MLLCQNSGRSNLKEERWVGTQGFRGPRASVLRKARQSGFTLQKPECMVKVARLGRTQSGEMDWNKGLYVMLKGSPPSHQSGPTSYRLHNFQNGTQSCRPTIQNMSLWEAFQVETRTHRTLVVPGRVPRTQLSSP